MRHSYLIFLFLCTVSCVSYAQNTVNDTHPAASIFIIDYQSGQQVAATSDAAILFKDAFIDLAINTNTGRQQVSRVIPGHKSFVITQLNPQSNGNTYQLSYQSKFLNQNITIYTFRYNVDQNTLYAYSQLDQTWVPELVQGANVVNMNNCLALGKFNYPDNGQPQDAAINNQQTDDDNTPVDTQVSATTVPPAMPEYQQPECPQDGYLWQPGYWAYSPDSNGYYWVPGVWVAPPNPGLLWTPPYWGFIGGVYIFHGGYWGSSIGFYGGINYGYGYGGHGYYGGEWREGHFRYNTAVVRVNVTVVHNTYVNTTVINNTVVNNHVSFNGTGGVMARPTPGEVVAMRETHVNATPEQIRNQRIARADRSQFASANGGGRPANLAAEKVPERNPNVNQNPRGNGNNGAIGGRPGFNGANNTNTNQPNSTNGRQGFNGANNTNTNQPNSTNGRQGFNGANNTNSNQPNSTNGRQGFNGANNANQPNSTGTRQNGQTGTNPLNQPNATGTRTGLNGTNGTRQGANGSTGTTPNQPNATGVRQGSNGTNPNQPNTTGTRNGFGGNKPRPQTVKPVVQQKEPPKKADQ